MPMSEQHRNRPRGRLYASIAGQGRNDKDRLVPIGAAWASKQSQNLVLQFDAEPLEWRDPLYKRTVVLVFAKEEDAAGADDAPPEYQ